MAVPIVTCTVTSAPFLQTANMRSRQWLPLIKTFTIKRTRSHQIASGIPQLSARSSSMRSAGVLDGGGGAAVTATDGAAVTATDGAAVTATDGAAVVGACVGAFVAVAVGAMVNIGVGSSKQCPHVLRQFNFITPPVQ